MVQRLRSWVVLLLALALGWWILSPRPALGAELSPDSLAPTQPSGAVLFAQHCAGCHINGGNVIRRGKTLRLAALRKAGLESGEDVARVASAGQGQMGGYEAVLGPDGARIVGDWVWQQALADWPKSQPKG
jgi:cytochrome c6